VVLLLYEVMQKHDLTVELQMHFFNIGLKHIEVSPGTDVWEEAWERWISGQSNRFVCRKPQGIRHGMSWKELRFLLDHFMSCVKLLERASPEHVESAMCARVVLKKVHTLWLKVTVCLKVMHHIDERSPVVMPCETVCYATEMFVMNVCMRVRLSL
jgi:hypothetical protein